jgi:hypothetical protein
MAFLKLSNWVINTVAPGKFIQAETRSQRVVASLGKFGHEFFCISADVIILAPLVVPATSTIMGLMVEREDGLAIAISSYVAKQQFLIYGFRAAIIIPLIRIARSNWKNTLTILRL